MSDVFQPLSAGQLVSWVFDELEGQGSVFGLPRSLFFDPSSAAPLRCTLFGDDQVLDTPFGVAAGPHSQMAQNIVVAWLVGSRFIELKTVQTLDELDVSKPCIDMQDEGYNVEWSQELKVDQSFEEYLRAFVLIHALHHKLGFAGEPNAIFNMSVGYDLAGIQKPNVKSFLARMLEPKDALADFVEAVAQSFPQVRELSIPKQISNNVTVSTMHGCPPEEIGKICEHLMTEWGLHTSVKLNPTLLGPEKVRSLLRDLGYDHIVVPDEAFGHDLKYPDAVELLTELRAVADKAGVSFGVKLCNTLEVENHRHVFQPKEKMMYMSGRPHHALAVHVAAKLGEQFDGTLPMSFAGGADAWNVAPLLAAGMTTITTCSDILRPGGYSRMLQYVEESLSALSEAGAANVEELICSRGGTSKVLEAARKNLKGYAASLLEKKELHKNTYKREQTKTDRVLGPFDCIHAPCVDTCPIDQRVPEYMDYVAKGDFGKAAEVIGEDNVMAAVLGRACTHACEGTCLRTHYDEPLAIREIKRFAADHKKGGSQPAPTKANRGDVGIVGGGPCGLSAASFLARYGFAVTVYESAAELGGMVSATIPAYRATQEAINQDLDHLRELGISLKVGQGAGKDLTLDELRKTHSHVVIAAGAQGGMPLQVPGAEAAGVLDGLEFLRKARQGKPPLLGDRIAVIGGGDVAMDCARTAHRLAEGKVHIVYRRTKAEMPAHREELDAAVDEGVVIDELLAPKQIMVEQGKLDALVCANMRLGEPDESGRRRPEEIPGKTQVMPLTNLIVAIGQRPSLDFLGDAIDLNTKGYIEVDPETFETSVQGVYAGGDAIAHGPETIVRALADGKAIAQAIAEVAPEPRPLEPVDPAELLGRRARRSKRAQPELLDGARRDGFDEIVATLEPTSAQAEASRCARCDLMCSTCATVCPNRAIQTYRCEPFQAELAELTKEGEPAGHHLFQVRQPLQVAVVQDFCNECGNCATFCPTSGQPYRDKPRLFLKESELEAEQGNAYMVTKGEGTWKIKARFEGATHTLTLGETLELEANGLTATLDPGTFEIIKAEATELPEPYALDRCATMYVLLRAIQKTALPK